MSESAPAPKKRRVLRAFLWVVLGVILGSILVSRDDNQGFSQPTIAIVDISGVLMDAEPVLDQLRTYQDDPMIKGVLLRMNTPGGAVAPAQEIYQAVSELKSSKPVYVSMSSLCASAGYYIASAGTSIYANPGSLTGSIGVIMEFSEVSNLLDNIGIHLYNLKAGEMKDAGSPTRKMSDKEEKYLQGLLNAVHEQFIQAVLNGRQGKISEEELRQWADGRILTGEQAYQLHFVDALGSVNAALAGLKQEIGLSDIEVYREMEEPEWLKLLEGVNHLLPFSGSSPQNGFMGISSPY